MIEFSIKSRLYGAYKVLRKKSVLIWFRYCSLCLWQQVVIVIVIVAVIFGILMLFRGSGTANDTSTGTPTVSLSTIGNLSGASGTVNVLGIVRSITEAGILAQSGGTVTALHMSLGGWVTAGFVIAELENASQRASVLQAEGAYEAAVAARSGASPTDIADSARNVYMTAYSTLDTLLESDIDMFYGEIGGQGPRFLVSYRPFDYSYFPMKRRSIADAMTAWREHLATVSSSDPKNLLDEADAVIHEATALGNDIAQSATKINSDATDEQLSALAAARSGFTSVQASITAAKSAYQAQNASATAGVDASVKIALGSLHAAQAQLEKTFIRTPISGTVNFLPIRIGDYVTAFSHAATVAQNGALEITAYVSEDNRAFIAVGNKVTVEDMYSAIITSISPALDPITKQIEVRIVLSEKSLLVNGQSVRIALPNDNPVTTASAGPILLPLTALKLTPSARAVFSVGPDNRLVAHEVTIGDVHGDRITIITPLPNDLNIVTDARGLSEGQKVIVAAQ